MSEILLYDKHGEDVREGDYVELDLGLPYTNDLVDRVCRVVHRVGEGNKWSGFIGPCVRDWDTDQVDDEGNPIWTFSIYNDGPRECDYILRVKMEIEI